MARNKKPKGGDTSQMQKLFAEGGMMDNSGETVNGVEVPPGSLKEEVADDIPAQLSEGEFVVPADVVRFIGLEKLMAMRDKAKQGLQRMEEMGQMGNADEVANPDQTFQDDEDFSSEIDDIMSEEGNGFATGGFITGGDLSKVPSNPVINVGYYKHADGRMMWITKINGKPMSPPPDGFSEVSAEEFQNVGKKAEDKQEAAAKTAGGSTSGGGGGGDSAGGVTSGDSAGIGPVPLGNMGLGLLDIGEKLGKTPSVMGQILGKAATYAGGKAADKAIDMTTEGFNTMRGAMPGVGTKMDKSGKITTFVTPQTIAKSDAAMFAPTPFESLQESIASSPMASQAASTGMVTNAAGQTVSNALTTAAQDAAEFGAISTGQGLGDAGEAAATGMTTVGGQTVSNAATIAAQDAAIFGADSVSAPSAPAAASAPAGNNPDEADSSDSGGGGGGSSKIICTAMNHAYGFGSFRNAIWIKYADQHLTKAHEVGYHTLFLPLVDYGFKQGDGKLNMAVRKVLEWGTRHRSMDLRAEMRGKKRDTTGRIIRAIFEPMCYIVGKLKGY